MTTAQSLLDKARKPLNDDAKVRYLDSDLLAYLNDGIQELRRRRPDLFIGRFTESLMPMTERSTVPIDEMYHVALADYVTARAQTIDADMSDEGRAMAFLSLANGSL